MTAPAPTAHIAPVLRTAPQSAALVKQLDLKYVMKLKSFLLMVIPGAFLLLQPRINAQTDLDLPLASQAAQVKQQFRDALIEHSCYVREHGEDMPAVRDWVWPNSAGGNTPAEAGD